MVAASDSRGTFGDPRGVTAQNDTMTKLFALTPHSVVTLAGAAELGVRLMSEVQGILRTNPVDTVSELMNIVRDQTRQRYSEWFPGWLVQPAQGVPTPQRPDLAMLIVGYDSDGGTHADPKIYQLISGFDFAPMQTATGFGLQGVAQYGLYLLNRLYVPDAAIEELKALAAYVITETASQDGKVGGPVQMATITPGTGHVIIPAHEVEGIIDANAKRSDKLRSSFFAGAGPASRRRGAVRRAPGPRARQ
jgi:20S proteasome alpha/beta subunit